MIKYVVILFATFILVQSQRPTYAGSSKPYPGVLPQYLDQQAAAVASATTGTVGSRIDVNSTNGLAGAVAAAAPSTPITTSTIPPDLPVDAMGDVALVNRIKTWPRDKQPFWFINWQQIQEHRGDSKNRAQPVETQPNQRSFFAG